MDCAGQLSDGFEMFEVPLTCSHSIELRITGARHSKPFAHLHMAEVKDGYLILLLNTQLIQTCQTGFD
jgi:hypothetical protein